MALDVARATRREGALLALKAYLGGLIEQASLPAVSAKALGAALEKACAFMDEVANSRSREDKTRHAASLLYHATSAVFMAWEGAKMEGRSNRLALAHLVLKHKLAPSDPFVPAEQRADTLEKLVADKPLAMEEACRILA